MLSGNMRLSVVNAAAPNWAPARASRHLRQPEARPGLGHQELLQVSLCPEGQGSSEGQFTSDPCCWSLPWALREEHKNRLEELPLQSLHAPSTQ